MATQDEFLKLDPDEARAFLEGKPKDVLSSWAYLYEARNGVALFSKEESVQSSEAEAGTN